MVNTPVSQNDPGYVLSFQQQKYNMTKKTYNKMASIDKDGEYVVALKKEVEMFVTDVE